MEDNNTPLIFDPEIVDILTAEDPLTRKYWPDIEEIKQEMIKENLGFVNRTILHFLSPATLDVSFQINKSEEKEMGYIRMYKKDELLESKTFKKEGIIPRESQDDFEAVYDKANNGN